MKTTLNCMTVLLACQFWMASTAMGQTRYHQLAIDYDAGRFEQVVRQSESLLAETSLDLSQETQLLKLLALSHLFLNHKQEAEAAYQQLLAINPIFRPSADEPALFSDLAERFEASPTVLLTLSGGVNLSFARVIEEHRIQEDVEKSYAPFPGWNLAVGGEILLFRNLYGTVEAEVVGSRVAMFQEVREDNPGYNSGFSVAELKYREHMVFLKTPVGIKKQFGKRKRCYLRLGLAPSWMMTAMRRSLEIDRNNKFEGMDSLPEPVQEIHSTRNHFSLSGHGALGIEWRIKSNYLAVELRYNLDNANVVNPDFRYSDAENLFRFQLVDDDFALSNLIAGIRFSHPFKYNVKPIKSRR